MLSLRIHNCIATLTLQNVIVLILLMQFVTNLLLSHCLFAFHLFTTLFWPVTAQFVYVDKKRGGFEFQAYITYCVIPSSLTDYTKT